MNLTKKIGLLIVIALGLGFTVNQMELKRFFPQEEAFEHPTIDTSTIKCPATSIAYTPKNTVFLIDFHYVIARMDWTEAWKNFQEHPQRFKTSMRLVSYLFKKMAGFKNDKESILEQYLNHENCDAKCRLYNEKLINSYRLDYNTVELLKDIKKKGYKLFFFSDMLPQTLKVQQQRQPELFKLFYAINIREPKNNFASKLTAARYEQMKEFVKSKLGYTPEHYLFLDDKKGNVSQASKAEICSIVFINAKQTETILHKLKIL
jgi:FMN phosphatase YigB (HAD superfamily)